MWLHTIKVNRLRGLVGTCAGLGAGVQSHTFIFMCVQLSGSLAIYTLWSELDRGVLALSQLVLSPCIRHSGRLH